MILAAQTVSFKSYIENPSLVLEVERSCPACMTRLLSRHGRVLRWVYEIGERQQIPIFRLRCRPCGLTATLLPDFLLPFVRYAATVVLVAIDAYLDGAGSYRAVAMATTGGVVPALVAATSNFTDALEVLRPKPGYQRIHAWVARVAASAADDVQAVAAWLTRLVPDSLVVDHLAVPLAPLASATRDPIKRAGLDGTRMLRRVLVGVEVLNPHGRPWIAAWMRVVTAVLGRTPWRAPPGTRGEPRGS